jgi:hypothetical protein
MPIHAPFAFILELCGKQRRQLLKGINPSHLHDRIAFAPPSVLPSPFNLCSTSFCQKSSKTPNQGGPSGIAILDVVAIGFFNVGLVACPNPLWMKPLSPFLEVV